MSNSFYKVLSSVPENPLYINDKEVILDGYDYKKVTSKIVDTNTTAGSSISQIPVDGYTGYESSASINNDIMAQVLVKSEGANVIPIDIYSAVANAIEMSEAIIGDTISISSWTYTMEYWSYHINVIRNGSSIFNADVDGIVLTYEPEKYDISIFESGTDYYSPNIDECFACNSATSGSFSLTWKNMPSTPVVVSDTTYLYRYSVSNDSWSNTNVELIDGRSFVYDGSYLWYLEYVNNKINIKRVSMSNYAVETILSDIGGNISSTTLCKFNNNVCLQRGYDTIYSISSSGLTLLTKAPVGGLIANDSDGTYLFSNGNGIYSYENGQWVILEGLDSSFNDLKVVSVANGSHDAIFVVNYEYLYHFGKGTGLTNIYTFSDSYKSISAYMLSNGHTKLYVLGTINDANHFSNIDIEITDIRYETNYIKRPRNSVSITSINSSKGWDAKATLGFTPAAIINYEDSIYAFSMPTIGSSSTTVKRYDNDSNEWKVASSIPYPICKNATFVVYNDVLYLLGSIMNKSQSGPDKTKSKLIHFLNKETGEWEVFKKNKKNFTCPYMVYGSVAIVYNGELHLFGGDYSGTSGSKRHMKYNGKKWVKDIDKALPFECFDGRAFILKNVLYLYARSQTDYGRYHIYRFDNKSINVKNRWTECIRVPSFNILPVLKGDIEVLNDRVYFFDDRTNTQYSRSDLPNYYASQEGSYSWQVESIIPGDTSKATNCELFKGFSIVVKGDGTTYIQKGLRLYTISFDEV